MNLKNPLKKKIIFVILTLALLVNSIFLIYGLVYASTESIYKKNGLIIGILFIAIARITISFYKSSIRKHSM
jgi:hypothetical protein